MKFWKNKKEILRSSTMMEISKKMKNTNINDGWGFISIRNALYKRLAELAEIEVMTEAECIEEQMKSREFWEWGAVERSLLRLSYKQIESMNATPLQNRIYRMAKENHP